MGYADTQPLTVFQIGSNNSDSFTLTTVAVDQDFNQNFEIPSWLTNRISKAFLIVSFPYQQNTHVANTNGCNTGTIQISTDAGATFHNAISIPSMLCYVGIAQTTQQHIVVYGTEDFASYGISPGVTVTVKWDNMRSQQNNLLLNNIQLYMNLIFY